MTLPTDVQKFIDAADAKHVEDGCSWAPHPFDQLVEYCQFCGKCRTQP